VPRKQEMSLFMLLERTHLPCELFPDYLSG
jgi:hypothetical protein